MACTARATRSPSSWVPTTRHSGSRISAVRQTCSASHDGADFLLTVAERKLRNTPVSGVTPQLAFSLVKGGDIFPDQKKIRIRRPFRANMTNATQLRVGTNGNQMACEICGLVAATATATVPTSATATVPTSATATPSSTTASSSSAAPSPISITGSFSSWASLIDVERSAL